MCAALYPGRRGAPVRHVGALAAHAAGDPRCPEGAAQHRPEAAPRGRRGRHRRRDPRRGRRERVRARLRHRRHPRPDGGRLAGRGGAADPRGEQDAGVPVVASSQHGGGGADEARAQGHDGPLPRAASVHRRVTDRRGPRRWHLYRRAHRGHGPEPPGRARRPVRPRAAGHRKQRHRVDRLRPRRRGSALQKAAGGGRQPGSCPHRSPANRCAGSRQGRFVGAASARGIADPARCG